MRYRVIIRHITVSHHQIEVTTFEVETLELAEQAVERVKDELPCCWAMWLQVRK